MWTRVGLPVSSKVLRPQNGAGARTRKHYLSFYLLLQLKTCVDIVVHRLWWNLACVWPKYILIQLWAGNGFIFLLWISSSCWKEKLRTCLKMQPASLWAQHSCFWLTTLYGCMFTENSPNSLHCLLSKYHMHIFKNTLINCSPALLFPSYIVVLPDTMPLGQTEHGTMRIKKGGSIRDLWVPLKTVVSVYAIASS